MEPEAAALYVRHIPFEIPKATKLDNLCSTVDHTQMKMEALTVDDESSLACEITKGQTEPVRRQTKTRHDFEPRDPGDDLFSTYSSKTKEVPEIIVNQGHEYQTMKTAVESGELLKLGAGSKYMVVDAGGLYNCTIGRYAYCDNISLFRRLTNEVRNLSTNRQSEKSIN